MKIEGKGGISAEIVCDSISPGGTRLTTMVLEYPRIIHAEVMTHRMLPKNSASSRAIPFNKMREQLTGAPVRFGAHQPGMQDAGEHNAMVGWPESLCGRPDVTLAPSIAWELARNNAVEMAGAFYKAGYAKQVYNRLTEPFQMMRVVISGTEWNNFFWLRNHDAADPTLQELGRCMQEAYNLHEEYEQFRPMNLLFGEWHVPFVEVDIILREKPVLVYLCDDKEISVKDALKVSAARCAAVSFRRTDYPLEKCIEVYNRLVGDSRKHASPLEHQATPIKDQGVSWHSPYTWSEGISHFDKNGDFWSGPFKHWIQHRKLIEGENHCQ